MTRISSALPLLALLSSAPLAAQAARDFQLPPAATPSPDTRVQGPVDTDAPVPVRPRVIETARPTPAPTSTATAAPAVILPTPAPSRAAAQPRQESERPAAALPRASAASAAAASSQQPRLAPPIDTAAPLPLPSPPVAAAPAVPIATAEAPAESPSGWLWVALGGLVAAAASALILLRRRRADAATPQIVVPSTPAASAPAEALAIAVEAVRMDRSVMNATVGYRVTIRNRTAQPLSNVAVEADLVSASGDRPAEQQLASTVQALTPRHTAERLAAGQSLRFEGQVRLPLSEASAIWQGRAALLVPLLRVRALANEAVPVVTTLVIGSAEGSSARPQPFRLDEPPRSYAPLAQRVLDAVPARA